MLDRMRARRPVRSPATTTGSGSDAGVRDAPSRPARRAGSTASWRPRRRPPASPSGTWHIRFGLGDFGTDYLARAGRGVRGPRGRPGRRRAARAAPDGRRRAAPLYGRHRYVLRFPPGSCRRCTGSGRSRPTTTGRPWSTTPSTATRSATGTASRSTPTARCRSASSTGRPARRRRELAARAAGARSTSCCGCAGRSRRCSTAAGRRRPCCRIGLSAAAAITRFGRCRARRLACAPAGRERPLRSRKGARRRKERRMCRWLAYSGSPILLREALYSPAHSLIDQSLQSRLGAETTNGDGFGIGWYGVGPDPGVFRSTEPAWNDANLRELAGHVSVARCSSRTSAPRAGRRYSRRTAIRSGTGSWLWMHNGLIDGLRAREARPRARRRPVAVPLHRRARPTPRSCSSSR